MRRRLAAASLGASLLLLGLSPSTPGGVEPPSPPVPAVSGGPPGTGGTPALPQQGVTPSEEAPPRAGTSPDAAMPPEILEEALASIEGKQALAHIRKLASDRMQGRDAGSPGCERAASYLVETLAACGLSPGLGKDGWLQEFPLAVPPRKGSFPGGRLPPGPFATANVLAKLEGRDPTLRGEWVVVGAHYDHLGQRKPGKVYRGADDNASGTAAVLEIAEAFARAPMRPRRSLLFGFFSAEEDGLLGSRWYVEHAVVPPGKTAAMINLDMVGRNDPKEVEVYGIESAAVFEGWLEELAAELDLEVLPRGGSVFARSDQYSFYEAKIPVLFLHGGLHSDYHQTRDVPQRIEDTKVERIARLGYLLAQRAAEAPQRPTFQPLPDTALAGPLGIVVAELDEDALASREGSRRGGALRVETVLEGSPAARAGIREGDLLLAVRGRSLPRMGTLAAYEKALEEIRGPVDCTLERDGKRATFRLKPRVRR